MSKEMEGCGARTVAVVLIGSNEAVEPQAVFWLAHRRLWMDKSYLSIGWLQNGNQQWGQRDNGKLSCSAPPSLHSHWSSPSNACPVCTAINSSEHGLLLERVVPRPCPIRSYSGQQGKGNLSGFWLHKFHLHKLSSLIFFFSFPICSSLLPHVRQSYLFTPSVSSQLHDCPHPNPTLPLFFHLSLSLSLFLSLSLSVSPLPPLFVSLFLFLPLSFYILLIMLILILKKLQY